MYFFDVVSSHKEHRVKSHEVAQRMAYILALVIKTFRIHFNVSSIKKELKLLI